MAPQTTLSRFFRPTEAKYGKTPPESLNRAKKGPPGRLTKTGKGIDDLASPSEKAVVDLTTTGSSTSSTSSPSSPSNSEDVVILDEPSKPSDPSKPSEPSSPLIGEKQAVEALLVPTVDSDTQTDTNAGASQVNPFAQFAASPQKRSSPGKQSSLDRWLPNSPRAAKKPRTFQSGGTEWIKCEDLPVAERERVFLKWHSLVDGTADLEDARFQMLVAARLHARCQEGPVRQAMQALRQTSFLTVRSMAAADPEELKRYCSNLQYYPTKSRHLVKAAQEIRSSCAGLVPEEMSQLLKLTGIGPVLADLLAYCNTRAAHMKRRRAVKSG